MYPLVFFIVFLITMGILSSCVNKVLDHGL